MVLLLLLGGGQVSNALSCSGGGVVNIPQTLTTGTHTVDNCVIIAPITVTSNAQLSVTGTSLTPTGIITVGIGATVSVADSTIGAGITVIGGTATITSSTFSSAGRVYGTGSGSTTVSVSGSMFADTSDVAAQVYCSFSSSGTHAWSLTGNQFVGRGVVSFVSGTFSALTFSSNDLLSMIRTSGTITAAVTFGTIQFPASGVLQMVSNQASSSTVDVASAGALALLHMGSTTSSGTGPAVTISSNTGFAQIVAGAATLSTGSSCTNPLVFSGNTAIITGAPSTLVVFELRTTSMSGCPVQISGNTYSITHSNTGAGSGLVALAGMPTTSSSAMTVDGNIFNASTKGGVDSMVFLIAESGSDNFDGAVTLSDNAVSITTTSGITSVVTVEDIKFKGGSLTISSTVGTLRSGTAASLLQFEELKLEHGGGKSGRLIISSNDISLIADSSAPLALLRGSDKIDIKKDDCYVGIVDNRIHYSEPQTLALQVDDGIHLDKGNMNVSYNIFSGCTSPMQIMPTTHDHDATATGCWNLVCGVYVKTLEPEATWLDWTVCSADAPTATTTTTTPPPTTTTITTLVPTNVSSTNASSANQVTDITATTTTPPQGASTPVTSSTGAVTLVGSAAFVDSASTVQLTAMFAVMACRSEGGDTQLARLVLNPLRVFDTPSADLLGSFVVLAGVCGLYMGIAQLVFHCIRRRTTTAPPTTAPTEGGEEDGDQVAEVEVDVEQLVGERIFRAKLYLMYPRVPVVVATLLLPGVVLESCSLLYGELMGVASGWEKFVAVVGLVAALAFITYQHVVGIFAKPRVLPRYKADDPTHNGEPDVDNLADLTSLASSGVKYTRESSGLLCSPSSTRGQRGVSFGRSAQYIELMEFQSTSRDKCPLLTSPTNEMTSMGNSWKPLGCGSSAQSLPRPAVNSHRLPFQADTPLDPGVGSLVPFTQSVLSTSERLSSKSNVEASPVMADFTDQLTHEFEMLALQSPRQESTGNNIQCSEWSVSNVHHAGDTPIPTIVTNQADDQDPENLTDEVLSPTMQLAVPNQQPSVDGTHHKGSTTTIPQQHPTNTGFTDREKDPWFVWYSSEEREQQRWIVRQTLMAMGHWSPYVARSVYCVATPSRPEVVPWMGPHNSWRLFLVSAIAAISPSNRDHCMYVQAMVAAICFVHGLLIYATRVFRIPALNPLQGAQSILLGLLACAPFIASADAQAAFGNTLMALSLSTVVLSLLAVVLEWRIRRNQTTQ